MTAPMPYPPEPIPVISAKRGHLWIRSKLRPSDVRCALCGDWWPRSGDLAPMPECPGEVDLRREVELRDQVIRRVRGHLHGFRERIDALLTEVP